MKKWKDLSICENLRDELLKSSCYIKADDIEICISSTLFRNIDLVKLLNVMPFNNITNGSYYIINEYNPALPIYYNYKKEIYQIKAGYEEHPVVGISWNGAHFIADLLGGRLPFEKEWEYCATGGNLNYKYPWGNECPTIEKANYGEFVGVTTPIKSYPPNEWGLYDMAGNAEEWCMDDYYPHSPYLGITDINLSLEKTVKGGGWNKGIDFLNCKARRGKWSRIGTVGIGFRVVWDYKEKEWGK
ncbi:TPA: formylglycine-generating enzyme family protein [Bacillus cereus]|uniref:formylglycine-generating enzyme family protein n=1 Tax=Bacillus paranthracis TaxID=2026186 RepID=UPI001E4B918F